MNLLAAHLDCAWRGEMMSTQTLCPLCNKYWPTTDIDTHAWGCTGRNDTILEEPIGVVVEEDVLACFICGSGDISSFHALEDCCHMACKDCLVLEIMRHVDAKQPSKIVCKSKDCNKAFLTSDYRALLSEVQREAWEASTMNEYVFQNRESYVECPKCKEVVERISVAKTDVETTKAKPPNSPVPLTAETIQHYNNSRFKCRSCETEFCSDCGTSPYHVGFTCASYETFKASAHCRFCDMQLKKENTAPAMQYSVALRDVCSQKECLARRDASCATTLKCGHACGGIIQDAIYTHLPCWECGFSSSPSNGPSPPATAPIDPSPSPVVQSSQCKDDYCNICWSESLGCAPSVRLQCSHLFHYHCIVNNLRAKWPGVVITFGFLECPLCKQHVSHPALASLLKPYQDLQADVQKKALDRFNHMNLKDVKELTDPHSSYHNNPLKYALARFCYYPCFKCKKPYFGGLKECNAEQRAAGKDDKLEDLVCGACAAQGSGASSSCTKHGTDYIEYKCKFCCNVAAWYCWGSTHFCEDCHKKAAEVAKIPKDKLPKCTCGGKHPPNGEEHCLGCSLCRFNDSF